MRPSPGDAGAFGSPAPAPFRAGLVAILGAPNVGKSTLLNALLDYRLSIVTPKPQTTQRRILGILNGPDHQALFLDTPGMLEPRTPLHEMMHREIERALEDCDVALRVVEPGNEPAGLALTGRRPVVLVINKIDTVAPRTALLPIIARYAALGYQDVHPVSALKREGIDALRATVAGLLPVGDPFYPPDQLTADPERFFAGELIREQIFELYSQEIPYASLVVIDEFREQAGRKDLIRAVIYVEKPAQKAILIGAQGRALRRLGTSARRSLEQFLGRPVFLELWVKVRPGWRRDRAFLRSVHGASGRFSSES